MEGDSKGNIMQYQSNSATLEHTAPSASRYSTPYHDLGDDAGPRIPNWAEHRSVYRGAGQTTYIVETEHFDRAAKRDLSHLAQHGWHVTVERASGRQARTRVGLVRRPSGRPANRTRA